MLGNKHLMEFIIIFPQGIPMFETHPSCWIHSATCLCTQKPNNFHFYCHIWLAASPRFWLRPSFFSRRRASSGVSCKARSSSVENGSRIMGKNPVKMDDLRGTPILGNLKYGWTTYLFVTKANNNWCTLSIIIYIISIYPYIIIACAPMFLLQTGVYLPTSLSPYHLILPRGDPWPEKH